jgi:hypothetical protein
LGINDSILNDGPLVGLSTTANGGMYALELRTYYNVTQNKASELEIGCDSNSSFFSFPIFPIFSKPEILSLLYSIKEFPTTPYIDTTMCMVKIMNSDFVEIGNGSVKLWQKNQWYLFKAFPIIYIPTNSISLGDSIPAFAHISFKHLVSTTTPHVGHRILIDDLAFITNPLSVTTASPIYNSVIYPNPTNDILKIEGNDITKIEIISSIGEMLFACKHTEVNLSALSSGIYFLKIYHTKNFEVKKITKK